MPNALTAAEFSRMAEESLAITLGADEVIEAIVAAPGEQLEAHASDLLLHLQQCAVLDVRTPGEFAHAHLPGAYNLPLFSDEERAAVGTTYKQVGREAAIALGWSFVQPRLVQLQADAQQLVPSRVAVVHCARGGLRSRSVAWLLRRAGWQVATLPGGYKSVRRQVLAMHQRAFQLCVLSGHTGSGKTLLLHELAQRGEQVVDLERLANHKGSAFGALGQRAQPSNEHFENTLACALAQFDPARRIWVEDESLRIGNCAVPAAFWQQMREAALIHLEVPVAARLDFLLNAYGGYPVHELQAAIGRIAKRLGGLRVKLATSCLASGDLPGAAAILLDYYDQSYSHSQAQRQASRMLTVTALTTDAQANASAVIAAADATAMPR